MLLITDAQAAPRRFPGCMPGYHCYDPGLMWHWCSIQRPMRSKADWDACRGKTEFAPLGQTGPHWR